jgi:hypothetical protein
MKFNALQKRIFISINISLFLHSCFRYKIALSTLHHSDCFYSYDNGDVIIIIMGAYERGKKSFSINKVIYGIKKNYAINTIM